LPTPGQIRAARGLLNLTQADLASVAGISLPTVKRFESGRITPDTREKIRAALERSGIDFIPENGGGAGVRLKK
jgi:predicted transcriptional regulator